MLTRILIESARFARWVFVLGEDLARFTPRQNSLVRVYFRCLRSPGWGQGCLQEAVCTSAEHQHDATFTALKHPFVRSALHAESFQWCLVTALNITKELMATSIASSYTEKTLTLFRQLASLLLPTCTHLNPPPPPRKTLTFKMHGGKEGII